MRHHSLLLDLPNELFFRACWYIYDVKDLASLAAIPAVAERLQQFIRVISGNERLSSLPSIFEKFQRFEFRSMAPEFSINLIEIDSTNKISRALFQKLYVTQTNIRNFLLIVGMVGLRRPDPYSLEWIWPEVTVLERESLRKEFNYRCIIVCTTKKFVLDGCKVDSSVGILDAGVCEEFTLRRTLFVGDNRWCCVKQVHPKILNIDDCSSNWWAVLDQNQLKEITIHYELRDPQETSPRYPYDINITSLAINLHDMSFRCLKYLDLDNVNCLNDIQFPTLLTLCLKITAKTKNFKELVIPLIRNVSAPCLKILQVEVVNIFPEVINFKVPICKSFSMKVTDYIENFYELKDTHVDKTNFFDIKYEDLYHKVPPEGTINEREIPSALYGWPCANEIILYDCSNMFQSLDHFTYGTTVTIVYQHSRQDNMRYCPQSRPDIPNIIRLNFIDKISVIEHKNFNYFKPLFTANGITLEYLYVSRSITSRLYLDFNDLNDCLPALKTVHIERNNKKDIIVTDRPILRHLDDLILEHYEIPDALRLLTSLRHSPLKTIILGQSSLSWEDPGDIPWEDQLATTLKIFSKTMKTAIICFEDRLARVAPMRCISLKGLRELVDLSVAGCETLILRDCPSLSVVQVRVGEMWHTVPPEWFETLDDCIKLDVAAFGESFVPVGETHWMTTGKRKASAVLCKDDDTRRRCLGMYHSKK